MYGCNFLRFAGFNIWHIFAEMVVLSKNYFSIQESFMQMYPQLSFFGKPVHRQAEKWRRTSILLAMEVTI